MTSARIRIALIAASCLALTACEDALDALRHYASSNIMYAPSSSMEPTIPINSRFTVFEVEPKDLRRGGIYIVQPRANDARILRLIAMPGDTVEMRAGKVWLNGKPLRLEPRGTHTFETQERENKTAKKFHEYLPGDATGHDVLDLRLSLIDTYGPVKLPDNRYFLLGDNRDNAADSRMNAGEFAESGVGLVRGEAITHYVDMESVKQ